jgi:maltooligosyltrehalose trehalohydrolase
VEGIPEIRTVIADLEEKTTRPARRLPVGAELLPGGAGIDFRVWAPKRSTVDVVFDEAGVAPMPLERDRDDDGYFAGVAPAARAGTRYKFRLDGGDAYPDPASRFQPDGPHGWSQVVDPSTYQWADAAWPGVTPEGQVLYELHIGTFTPEGTYAAAERELSALKEVGVTCLELMPLAEWAGTRNWGYDGVDLFAPTRNYGSPDDLRRFVDRCHALGLGVILDVVYNHLGPDGCYVKEFSDTYFTQKHKYDWGESLNFDDAGSDGVRAFFLANARHWIEEYHFDGFRFDATQAIVDDSPEHILAAIAREARAAAGSRAVYLVDENEPQRTELVRPAEAGGYGHDALWNDDFHHAAMVKLSGRNEAYRSDYFGAPQEFVSAAKWGYLFQGQIYRWQWKRRGTPALDLPPTAFVNYIQNHDQIANSGTCLRAHMHSGMASFRAMSALLCLAPQTPLLFMGQEWAASTTFHFFVDHGDELAKLVREGRAKELGQFPSVAMPEMTDRLLDPNDPGTFQRCKLNHAEGRTGVHAQTWLMHRDLLRLRREEPVFRRVQRRGDIDGAVLGPDQFLLRFFGKESTEDRLLMVNFGTDHHLMVVPEPLLASPPGTRWQIQLSTEDPKYGGGGTPPLETCGEDWRLPGENWTLPGRCAVVLKPAKLLRPEREHERHLHEDREREKKAGTDALAEEREG